MGLNDAYVDRVVLDRKSGDLKLLLLTGSIQVGYWRSELRYSGAKITVGEDVLKAALKNRPTEIWYDEFTIGNDGCGHAFLLAPPSGLAGVSQGEFRIVFEGFDYTQTLASDRVLATAADESRWAPQ